VTAFRLHLARDLVCYSVSTRPSDAESGNYTYISRSSVIPGVAE